MSMTAIDCWAPFAKQMANVICCPQLEATLAILIGQSSKDTNVLALNGTLAKYCLSDIEQILVGQGASERLRHICTVHPANLTEGSCPAKDISEFEATVDTSKLLAACNKIDPVKECCNAICQNAISEAATKIAMISTDFLGMPGSQVLPEQSTRVRDCKTIVLRWLASKLHPANAKEVLRVLSNCNVNKGELESKLFQTETYEIIVISLLYSSQISMYFLILWPFSCLVNAYNIFNFLKVEFASHHICYGLQHYHICTHLQCFPVYYSQFVHWNSPT